MAIESLEVLLVDDDSEFAELVKEYLEAKGDKVHVVNAPGYAVDVVEREPIDVCILDINMPGMDGFELAALLKEKFQELPFVFLSGQGGKEERLKGLYLGADDYMVKPFSLEELHLRIHGIMRRIYKQPTIREAKAEKMIYLGKIVFDPDYQQLNVIKRIVRLTSIENRLLKILCDHLNNAVSREEIMQGIWGNFDEYKSKSLNVYITRLRKYLEDEPNAEILNLHGEGYKLVARV